MESPAVLDDDQWEHWYAGVTEVHAGISFRPKSPRERLEGAVRTCLQSLMEATEGEALPGELRVRLLVEQRVQPTTAVAESSP